MEAFKRIMLIVAALLLLPLATSDALAYHGSYGGYGGYHGGYYGVPIYQTGYYSHMYSYGWSGWNYNRVYYRYHQPYYTYANYGGYYGGYGSWYQPYWRPMPYYGNGYW